MKHFNDTNLRMKETILRTFVSFSLTHDLTFLSVTRNEFINAHQSYIYIFTFH